MKWIDKGHEPHAFSEWKASDKMAHRPRWNRVDTKIKKKVHESLMCEQGFICCYCEVRISESDSHVEHFRPKGKKEYSDLQLDYDNLLCSCQRETSKGEPRHCGNRKGSWFDEDLLVSPLTPDCEERFRFTANGDILPRQNNDAGAEKTIQRLGLNLDKLRALRSAALEDLVELSGDEILQLLIRGEKGHFLPFHTTIKQVLT